MNKTELRKLIKEEIKSVISDGFDRELDDWVKLFKKHGYIHRYDSYGDSFVKRYETGVVIVEITSGKIYNEDYRWRIYYFPYVKVEKQYLGLLKKHLAPKSVDLTSGEFDFGTGLFKVDSKKVLKNFDRLLKVIDKRVKKIKPEWWPASDKQNPMKSDFWTKKGGGHLPSKILYKNPKDYTGKAI